MNDCIHISTHLCGDSTLISYARSLRLFIALQLATTIGYSMVEQLSMDTRKALLNFIDRINDAYVAGQTIHSLITDNEYQRLTLKHGKAVGTPLGNRHMLPGYWFSVFVAPFEVLQRMTECMRIEKEANDNDNQILFESIEKMRTNVEALVSGVDPHVVTVKDTFPNQKPLVRICNAISHGCYGFSEENGEVVVSFAEYDQLCGYQFEAKVTVIIFNRFASDFLNRLNELVLPVIEKHAHIAKGVSEMQLTVMI